MKPINPKTTLIPAKPGSLIVRAFLISLGLLMSPGVIAQIYLLGGPGPGGGIVFSVDTAGEHGLEAQAADASNSSFDYYQWASGVKKAASYNTDTYCKDSSNSLKDPTCWHLPTKYELNLLYQHRTDVGGFDGAFYWSSTLSIDKENAWFQKIPGGSQYLDLISTSRKVRAVRQF